LHKHFEKPLESQQISHDNRRNKDKKRSLSSLKDNRP
jgi:hypothetical protein